MYSTENNQSYSSPEIRIVLPTISRQGMCWKVECGVIEINSVADLVDNSELQDTLDKALGAIDSALNKTMAEFKTAETLHETLQNLQNNGHIPVWNSFYNQFQHQPSPQPQPQPQPQPNGFAPQHPDYPNSAYRGQGRGPGYSGYGPTHGWNDRRTSGEEAASFEKQMEDAFKNMQKPEDEKPTDDVDESED